MKRSIQLLRWANLILVLVTLLAYISPYVSPINFWPLSFLGLFFPFLILFNLFFILFWALSRKRHFIFSLLTIVVGWGYLLSFIGFGKNSLHLAEEGSFKFTSFNAHSIVPKKNQLNEERNKAYGDFADMISQQKSQVFCFQEVPNLPRAISKSREMKPKAIDPAYQILQDKRGSLGILTNLPVLRSHSEYYEYRTNGYQWADLQLNDHQIIRVFNLHLQSNGITRMTRDVSNGNLGKKKTWKRIKNIMGQYKRAAQKRARQAKEVAEAIQQSPHPVIICGDLNDVPTSYAYRVISESMQDSFKEKGGGFATTYTGPIPGLRIDYIFVSYPYEIQSFQTGKRNFSDHKPVSTIIRPRL